MQKCATYCRILKTMCDSKLEDLQNQVWQEPQRVSWNYLMHSLYGFQYMLASQHRYVIFAVCSRATCELQCIFGRKPSEDGRILAGMFAMAAYGCHLSVSPHWHCAF